MIVVIIHSTRAARAAAPFFSFHFSDFRSRSYEECILCGRVVEEHVGSQLDP